MRPALADGAAFVCGEMGHITSHALCRDQRAIWMHSVITFKCIQVRARRCMNRYTRIMHLRVEQVMHC